jgi:protein-arginine kinase activator protein McsA
MLGNAGKCAADHSAAMNQLIIDTNATEEILMLIQSSGSCDRCGSSGLAFTEQEASVTCKKCGKEFKICEACKRKGCPRCGGKLESQMDRAAKSGIMF